MNSSNSHAEHALTCDCSRRGFLVSLSATAGVLTWSKLGHANEASALPTDQGKAKARIRVFFLYPPSKQFAQDPAGWWSWPGNDFDAEGRQQTYLAELSKMATKLGVELLISEQPIATKDQARLAAESLTADPPDGLLLVMFYNRSLEHADILLDAAGKVGLPSIFYVGLGVKHGAVDKYRRPGLYFIQSLDNYPAIEAGLRMIHTKKRASQSRLLSITEAKEPREGTETLFGINVRVIPFDRYAEEFQRVTIDDVARQLIGSFQADATELRGITPESLENAARAHLAIKRLLQSENADGLTMNCLRRGMLKPCMSFATLNNQLIPAACENDLPAAYTQLLGQLLTGRPGFQHNPCYETENNHYYASHCTCATRLHGPDQPQLPFLLRRFAHTNEGSCAIQVFWNPGDDVTMVRYYPGSQPSLDVYAGRVVQSHPMPPAAGCTTNVEIELTDRQDACSVQGHHNLLFCGDFARRFRMFANLYSIPLANTGYEGPWPG